MARRAIPDAPEDYLNFLRRSDGAEGAIGRKNYLVLWPAEEVEIANKEYAANEFTPGLVLIGTDGGNTGYGFDCRVTPPVVVEMPLVGMNWMDARTLGSDFSSFIRALSEED